MICEQLIGIAHLNPAGLRCGSNMHELRTRPGCTLFTPELDIIHDGKDASILHMLEGGSGFPYSAYVTPSASSSFDLGCTQERKDLRQLLDWELDLTLCLADRKKGTVQ